MHGLRNLLYVGVAVLSMYGCERAHLQPKDGAGHSYRISKEEGEYDLVKSCCKRGLNEDIWAYHNGRFTDVGDSCGKNFSYTNNSVLDSIILDCALYHKNDTIFLYHNHPTYSFDQEFYPPSAQDYINSRRWKEFTGLFKVNLATMVADSNGIYLYSMSDETREFLKKDDRFIPYWINYTNDNRIFEIGLLQSLKREKMFDGDIISEYISYLKAIGDTISFRPIK